jgi:KipI family sensor histidine kinase inhibitor
VPDAAAAVRLSAAGSGALLLDVAQGSFDMQRQRRIWGLADAMRDHHEVQNVVPGMNNLLVLFDPLQVSAERLESLVLDLWHITAPRRIDGHEVQVAVTYGGRVGGDLEALAEHCGLSVPEVVRIHSEPTYTVAAIGALPGLPYLAGLDPRLARERRATPRMRVESGAVIIAGAQASILPCTAPSGWHAIGHTPLRLFDASQPSPALLRPGDTIRFVVAAISPCSKS